MALTDLSNTIKKFWEKISFHKHFKELQLVAGASVDCLFAVQMSLSISLVTSASAFKSVLVAAVYLPYLTRNRKSDWTMPGFSIKSLCCRLNFSRGLQTLLEGCLPG